MKLCARLEESPPGYSISCSEDGQTEDRANRLEGDREWAISPGKKRKGSRRAPRRRFSGKQISDEEYDIYDDDIDLDDLSPSSQRRAKRRLANRECARRIRQKKMDHLNVLSGKLDVLEKENSMLWHKLTEVATMWRDVARVNCQLEAKLTVSRLSAAFQRSTVGLTGPKFVEEHRYLDRYLAEMSQNDATPQNPMRYVYEY